MAPVDWSALSPDRYERMVAMLLNHLHHEALRIDGAGGDGGRDVQLAHDDGIEAFELKSFTGRLSRARRRQVQRSLERAAQLGPMRWTLVVPIDPTPRETEWFDGLRAHVPFPLVYRGKTWLDARLADRPTITRYFLGDARSEIERLAGLYRVESAPMTRGLPDAIDRLDHIASQLDELDPYYTYEVTVGAGTNRVRVKPRYLAADVDRPITIDLHLRFPDDEAGRAAAAALQESRDYGLPLDLSHEYVVRAIIDGPAGLGGDFENVSVSSRPNDREPVERTFLLAATAEDGRALAELRIQARLASQGNRGAIWRAVDATGSVHVELKVDGQERSGHLKMRVEQPQEYYPHDAWPAVRFLDRLVGAAQLELRTSGGDTVATSPVPAHEPFVDPRMAEVLEGLTLIQAASGMVRKVPSALHVHALNTILATKRLLAGGTIDIGWDSIRITVSPEAPLHERARLLDRDIDMTLITHEPHVVTIEGVSYALGRRARIDYHARVHDVPEAWRLAGAVPAGVELDVIPGMAANAQLSLVSDDAISDGGRGTT